MKIYVFGLSLASLEIFASKYNKLQVITISLL